MTRLARLLLLFIAAQFLVPVQSALADTGPKPTMEFTFRYQTGEPLEIVSGILYECDQSDCSDAGPIEEVGPQRFYCEGGGCRALAYGFAPYHRIEIEFSDGQARASNVFGTAGFDSRYQVTVRADDLLVEPQFSPLGWLPRNLSLSLVCLCAFLIGLLGLGLAVFLILRRSKR